MNKEEMKKQFLGKEKNGTMERCEEKERSHLKSFLNPVKKGHRQG